jgi:hypothetical protein
MGFIWGLDTYLVVRSRHTAPIQFQKFVVAFGRGALSGGCKNAIFEARKTGVHALGAPKKGLFDERATGTDAHDVTPEGY